MSTFKHVPAAVAAALLFVAGNFLVGCSKPTATSPEPVSAQAASSPTPTENPVVVSPLAAAEQRAKAGKELLKNGDYEQAVEQFTIALRQSGASPADDTGRGDSAIYLQRGIAYLNMGFPDTAADDFQAAIKLTPHDPAPYEQRAIASTQLGDLYKALRDATEAIRLKPNNATAYYIRGVVYLRRGQFNRSVADLEMALAEDPALTAVVTPQLGEVYYRWSRDLASDGKPTEAAEKLAQAKSLNPEYARRQQALAEQEVEVTVVEQTVAKPIVEEADAHLARGREYQIRGENDQALIQFTESIAENRQQAEAYLRRGETLLAMGFPDSALEDLQSAATNGDSTAELYRLESRAHFELGNDNRAVMSATDALHIDPTDATSYALRGQAYLRMENWDRAIIDLNEAMRRDPGLKSKVEPSLVAAQQGRDAALQKRMQAAATPVPAT